jgi:isoquinoline 1-oxidoreductase beta subunit
MLFGTVKMSPRFWSTIASADTSKAEEIPGVVKIVRLASTYGHGFGIIAENTWAAFRAADAIVVRWSEPEYPADSKAISGRLQDALASSGGSSLRDDGNVDTAFADVQRGRLIEAAYEVPYLAHACMEPMNATARLKDGVLEVWSGNQMPTITRQLCASATGIDEGRVRVHTTCLGGGFGRRVEMDYSIYAALLAQETGGRPVKVTWSREEDIQHDVYRPPAAGRFRARLGENGLPVAVEMRIATPSLLKSVMRRTFPFLSPMGPERNLTEGAFDQPYTIANYRVTGIPADISVPVGFWRSVGNSFNGFFHECFMDEIAEAGGIDPVEMRLKLMARYPTAVKVVEKVAAMSGWGVPAAHGRAKGLAFTLSFGGWVGEVVQVADTPDGVRVEKVWIAADVGPALDPRIIEAQLISGAIFGLSSAIGQEITFADGMVEQSNFHDFDAMRLNQCPEFEVAILENAAKMGGVGEIGTPPAIPALANAVAALTGKRVRRLPLGREITFA